VPVSTSTRQGVGVAAPAMPPSPTTPGVTPPALGSIAVISELTVSPAAFRAASRGAAIARRRAPAGTTVSYNDSQAVTTAFTVLRQQSGIARAKRGCVKPPHAAHKAKGMHCTRYVRLGNFIHTDHSGPNRFRFTGRVAGRALRPGRYLLQASPVSGGRTAKPSARTFRIIP
jgi:hypothetical protein